MKLKEVYAQYKDQEAFIKAVNEQLVKLIDENSDFCYVYKDTQKSTNQCLYNGPPVNKLTGKAMGPPSKGCIFGQALQNMGWSDKEELNTKYPINTLMKSVIGDIYWKHHMKWSLIQNHQDRGFSWGSLKELI